MSDDFQGPAPSTQTVAGHPSVLTPLERIQATATAMTFVLQIHTVKVPLRRLILEEVRRLLGEDA